MGKWWGKAEWENGNGCHQVIFGGQEALIFHSQPGISFHSISRALFTFWQTHFLHSPGKIEKNLSGKQLRPMAKNRTIHHRTSLPLWILLFSPGLSAPDLFSSFFVFNKFQGGVGQEMEKEQ